MATNTVSLELSISDAEDCDSLLEAVVQYFNDDITSYIEIDRVEDPIRIDGHSTPLQGTHSIEDAVHYMQAQGGMPARVHDGYYMYTLADPDDYDPDDDDWQWIVEKSEIDITIHWPDDDDDITFASLARLISWAVERGIDTSDVRDSLQILIDGCG